MLPRRLEALRPFDHDIEIEAGVWTNSATTRLRAIRELLWPTLLRLCGGSLDGLRVLDVGCNCGGVSFLAEEHGAAEVVGVDPHARNIGQAVALRDELGSRRTNFVQSDIDAYLEAQPRAFDVVLLLGVLYHLRDPIGTAQRLSTTGAQLWMIDTHVHYTTDAGREDLAMWWMLTDNDAPARGGASRLRPGLDEAAWAAYAAEHPVDYTLAEDRFRPAPHSARERDFVASARGGSKHVDPTHTQLAAAEPAVWCSSPTARR
jgi:SAM-dependent methyltransferase